MLGFHPTLKFFLMMGQHHHRIGHYDHHVSVSNHAIAKHLIYPGQQLPKAEEQSSQHVPQIRQWRQAKSFANTSKIVILGTLDGESELKISPPDTFLLNLVFLIIYSNLY